MIRLALCPDGSTMAMNDPLDDREPDSRPLEFRLGMESLEGPKHLFCVLHLKANAIISYKNDVIL
jgi:hypothetical protein